MQQNNCHIRVLVKGRPIDEYFMDGKYYVEGRAETEFDIEISNNNPFSVGTMLAVDGLSVLNGKPAGEDSPVYVVPANTVSVIKGWKLDAEAAAAFKFTGKKGGSYVEQSTDSGANKGVIGAIFFKEKYRATEYMSPFGLRKHYSGNGGNVMRSMRSTPSGHVGNLGGAADLPLMGMAANSEIAASLSLSNAAPQFLDQERSRGIAPPVQQNLGTAFGDKTDFKTTSTTFERGDIVTKIVLFYNDSDALRKMGIVLNRPSRSAYRTQPNPFPASTGCAPPRDWQG